ncbi:hypothetical protein BD310DRAFT_814675 [Dichomitus squalens]|uniref:DUF6534 domain-containing protein n=1 Tax=Dichomitus squalens TaxID=114155 RepID=A0A4Q9Q141_9APHY|nr:hypothetical protein BD310DRAFT_814675 [Dichomitus squalens]
MASLSSLDDTLGAVFVGYSVGLARYGSNLQQAYRYFRVHSADSWSLKAMVIVLLVLDTLHMVQVSQIMYHYLISDSSNPSGLFIRNCTVLIQTPWHHAFPWISVNRGFRPILPLVVSSGFHSSKRLLKMQSARSGLGPVFSGELHLSLWQHVNIVGLSIGFVTDFFLASTLVWILRCARSDFRSTNSLLDTLIVYTVNTCALTGGLLMLSMIFLIILPETDVFLGVLIPGARAYSASVLAVLNSRTSLSERFRHKNDIGTFGLVGYISSRVSGEDITSAGPDEVRSFRILMST